MTAGFPSAGRSLRAIVIVIAIVIVGCGGSASHVDAAADADDATGDVAADVDACAGELVGGRCRVQLVTGQERPYDLAVNATHVYWTTTFVPPPGHGKLMRVALAGGPPEELAAGKAGDNPHSIVLDDTSVYWTDFTPTSGAILKMPLAGGEPVVIAANQDDPHGLAVDATSVTWTTYLSPGEIRRASKAASAGAPSVVTDLAVDEALPNNVTVDGTFAYWTNSVVTTGAVRKAALDGASAPVTLAVDQDRPYGIAVDATNVYWTNIGGGQVMARPLVGAAAPVALATGQPDPYRLIVDGGSLYWACYPGTSEGLVGGVRTATTAGGAWIELSPATTFHVAIGGDRLYWTSFLPGASGGTTVTGGSIFQLTPR